MLNIYAAVGLWRGGPAALELRFKCRVKITLGCKFRWKSTSWLWIQTADYLLSWLIIFKTHLSGFQNSLYETEYNLWLKISLAGHVRLSSIKTHAAAFFPFLFPSWAEGESSVSCKWNSLEIKHPSGQDRKTYYTLCLPINCSDMRADEKKRASEQRRPHYDGESHTYFHVQIALILLFSRFSLSNWPTSTETELCLPHKSTKQL